MKSKHVPIRTCVGCREKFPQEDLIRLKLIKGKVTIVPPRTSLSGRSIYLCPRESCWKSALKRGKLVFKTAKHNRLSVHLSEKERDMLMARLRQFARKLLGEANG